MPHETRIVCRADFHQGALSATAVFLGIMSAGRFLSVA